CASSNCSTYPSTLRRYHLPSLATTAGSIGAVYRLFPTTNLFKESFWWMVLDVLRFNTCMAVTGRVRKKCNEVTKGREGIDNGYSNSFRDGYVMSVATSIWSSSPSKCKRGFSARSILRFMHNHDLLRLTGKPKSLSPAEGHIRYVKKVIAQISRGTFWHSAPLQFVTLIPTRHNPASTKSSSVPLPDASKSTATLSWHVTPPPPSKILKRGDNGGGGGMWEEEETIFGGPNWTHDLTVLHSDVYVLPRSENAWCAWNYVTRSELPSVEGPGRADTDKLASLDEYYSATGYNQGPIICTLNPTISIKEEPIQTRGEFQHSMFNAKAGRRQKLMLIIQNTRNIIRSRIDGVQHPRRRLNVRPESGCGLGQRNVAVRRYYRRIGG
ncbi:hypothetical protein CPB86DRAFT_845854, partial [Serendipita vermifera]